MLTLYLVRALGPGDYGLFALALSIATLLVLASDYGFTGAAGRFIAERRGEPRVVAGVIWDATVLKLAVLVPVCAGLAALAGPISDAYGSPELEWPLRAMSLVVLGQGMFLLSQRLRRARARLAHVVGGAARERLRGLGQRVARRARRGRDRRHLGRAAGYLFGALVAAVFTVRFIGRRSFAARSRATCAA